MIIEIIENNGLLLNPDKRIIEINPAISFSGLKSTYPTATTPLADDDKVIVRQGNEWRQADKSQFGGASNPVLKFEWSGKISFSANKKKFSLLNYLAPRNAYLLSRAADEDIMLDYYSVPFINALPFDIEITDIIFDIGRKSHAEVYDLRMSVMTAEYTDKSATKRHIMLTDTFSTNADGWGDIGKLVKFFDFSDFDNPIIPSGHFVTLGIEKDNTEIDASRYLHFASITILAKKI